MFQQTQSLATSPDRSATNSLAKELAKNPSDGALSTDDMKQVYCTSFNQFVSGSGKADASNGFTRESSTTGYSSDEGNHTPNEDARGQMNGSPMDFATSADRDVKITNFVNDLTTQMRALDLTNSVNGIDS